MQLRFIRVLDQVLGPLALLTLAPLCWVARFFLPKQPDVSSPHFTFLKLHGGGSLIIAMPALLGLRKKYPNAIFTLVCTDETKKYAELTHVFNQYVMIKPRSLPSLVLSGFEALAQCYRHDLFIDLEPHSTLAAVFTLLSFSKRSIGFVKGNELYRAHAYTEGIYFNPHAPIYAFYDQVAIMLDAAPASIDETRHHINADLTIESAAPHAGQPVLYLAPFCSDFAPVRMMPLPLWPRLIDAHYGKPATILIGGGAGDKKNGDDLKQILAQSFPQAEIFNLCGTRNLTQCVADIRSANMFWGIDSGALHIARLLGKPCRSFWGPTNPAHRLRSIPGLQEEVSYLGFACSPCIDSVRGSPCGGNNRCMKMFLAPPTVAPPIVIGNSD